MKKIKLLALIGLLFIFTGVAIERKEVIISYVNYLSGLFGNNQLEITNEYSKDYDFTFVKRTTDFHPKNYQDILNIYYTALNNGLNEFTFKCDVEYTECLNDVDLLANSQETLSDINNYVHPFNSFTHLETTYNNLGNVTFTIVKAYSQEDIDLINAAIDDLYGRLVIEGNSLEQNIKNIHDYIINNTRYDINKVNEASYTALGPLFNGTAVCSGYADLMALFLNKFGIKNYKIASNTHVWNALFINGEWLHLDLTWDDPITKNSDVDTLQHDFFLVKTSKLLEFDTKDHKFDTTVYQEMK